MDEMSQEKKILRNGLILRPGDNPPVLEAADIFIAGGIIVAVDTIGMPFPIEEADEVLNLQGRAVMPGLINAHTHTALTLLRGVAQDVDLHDFFGKLGPHASLIRRENTYAATLLALAEMIHCGVTTCVDMFQWMDESARAVVTSGMRAGLVCEFAGVVPRLSGTRGPGFSMRNGRLILDDVYGRERLAQAEEEIAACRALNCERLFLFLGPHATYSCSADLLAETAATAERLQLPISIHLAEEPGLEAQVRRRYGSTPKLLQETGLLKHHCLGVHCIYLNHGEITTLADNDFAVAHCPGSNLKLGEKLAPVTKFLASGISVGLGTDSVMSNDNFDLLEEARLAALGHKGQERSALALAGDLALQMATTLGATAIGQGGRIGRLQPNYCADLIVLNTDGVHWQPRRDPLMTLLYAASARDVTAVMVNGQWIMRDNVILTFDETQLIAAVDGLIR